MILKIQYFPQCMSLVEGFVIDPNNYDLFEGMIPRRLLRRRSPYLFEKFLWAARKDVTGLGRYAGGERGLKMWLDGID